MAGDRETTRSALEGETAVLCQSSTLLLVLAERAVYQGPGTPGSQREKVFEPFYRVDGSRNPDAGVVGLGLSVARSIARPRASRAEAERRRASSARPTFLEDFLPRSEVEFLRPRAVALAMKLVVGFGDVFGRK